MAAAFPVTTAFELPGKVVERNLGITFGLVVRAMGFSKTVAGGFRRCAKARFRSSRWFSKTPAGMRSTE